MSVGKLREQYPGRERELDLLECLFAKVSEPVPETVYIHGQPATGKTTLMRSFVEQIDAQFAYINCIECYTPRLLFDHILCSLIANSEESVRCDNFMELVNHLKTAHGQSVFDNRFQILIMDGVEHLSSLGSTCVQFFAKLQELTSIWSLSVIFIARVTPEKFDLCPSVVIHFPQYGKGELLTIFKQFKPPDVTEELYNSYISSALAVFLRATRDLVEMKTLVLRNVAKYVEPISKGEATANDVMLLWRLVTPHLRASLNSAYQGISHEEIEPSSTCGELLTRKRLKAFDLPYYAKYFLIASYLASYNSPKHDRRLYMKNHGKQRKRKNHEISKTKDSELLGPKSFSLDRLLAIFYAIMEDKASLTVNLISQIASLVQLRLLAKMGDGNIDNPKFKCLANYDCVAAVADTLGFNVKKYIID